MMAFHLLALLIASAAGATADPAPLEGINLDTSNFKKVQSEKKAYLIEFYSRMCGSCKEFAPAWHVMAQSATKWQIAPARVNIDDQKGMALAEKLGILEHGIPTVQLMRPDGELSKIMGGEDLEELLGKNHALIAKTLFERVPAEYKKLKVTGSAEL
jgi:thioredoxin-like negative regulator of GroEL